MDAIGFSLGAKTLLKVVAGALADALVAGALSPALAPQVATLLDEAPLPLIVAGVGANLFRFDDMSAVVRAVRTSEDGDIPALGYFSGLAQLPGNDREALAACMANGGGRVSADELAAVTCPVLVVLGEYDFVQSADQLIDALVDSRLVTLPRTDHARTPKSFEFIDAALDFLRSQT